MVHELKTWIEYFQMMVNGVKPFELRKNDRGFKVGHKLLLKEYDKENKTFTGRILHRRITCVLSGAIAEKFGLKEGFCVLGLEEID